MRDVVGYRIVDRRIAVERLLGARNADAPRKPHHMLAAAIEADEELAGDEARLPMRRCRVRSRREQRREKDKGGCGDQLSHGPRRIFPRGGRKRAPAG
jgi:hypothetical protein